MAQRKTRRKQRRRPTTAAARRRSDARRLRQMRRRMLIVLVAVCVVVFALGSQLMYDRGNIKPPKCSPVSEEVAAYDDLIGKYAGEYGVKKYKELIKAMMMQESRGRGLDPMQSSECMYNERYSRSPGAITDPEYSIDCGVHMFADSLKMAKVRGPRDMNRIRLALQGYNFGNGYITWALDKYGKYSRDNAEEFANKQASSLGWSSYGDTEYTRHVLKFYKRP